jgi:uncharacterized protein (DUF1919 family)
MKYTIISNCCGGADIYIRNGVKFTNPFVWSEVFESDLFKLIEHFEKLNFDNYDLERKENKIFGVKVDDTFTIWFPHYKFDANCTVPTKIGFDTCYNKNYEYVLKKYIDRSKRMTSDYIPFFLIFSYNDKISSKENTIKIQQLLETMKVPSILITGYDIKGTDFNKVIVDKTVQDKYAPTPAELLIKHNIITFFKDKI